MRSCCVGSKGGVLPPHHRDPFDRVSVAQTQIEELTFVTADSTFTHYDVRLRRVRSSST